MRNGSVIDAYKNGRPNMLIDRKFVDIHAATFKNPKKSLRRSLSYCGMSTGYVHYALQ
jgi:hypothetical protein